MLLWIVVISLGFTLLLGGLCMWNFWSMFRPGEVQEWRVPAHAVLGGLASLSFSVTIAAFIWFLIDKYV